MYFKKIMEHLQAEVCMTGEPALRAPVLKPPAGRMDSNPSLASEVRGPSPTGKTE